MSKGAFHRLAPNLTVEYPDIRFFNLEPGYVETERAIQNAAALGLEGRYPGAPPTVPAAVIAWLATAPEAADLNGQMITAQTLREGAPRSTRRGGDSRAVDAVHARYLMARALGGEPIARRGCPTARW